MFRRQGLGASPATRKASIPARPAICAPPRRGGARRAQACDPSKWLPVLPHTGACQVGHTVGSSEEGYGMEAVRIATWSEIPERTPVGAVVDGIDLVVIRRGDEHSVLYGR